MPNLSTEPIAHSGVFKVKNYSLHSAIALKHSVRFRFHLKEVWMLEPCPSILFLFICLTLKLNLIYITPN